jgi:Histidine kinase
VPRHSVAGSFIGYIGTSVDITERKLAEGVLSSQKLIEAHEEEGSRIARELHDDINQRLAVLSIRLSYLTQGPPASTAECFGHFVGQQHQPSRHRRYYTSLDQIIEDVNVARIYTGFHYRSTLLRSNTPGIAVANWVNDNMMTVLPESPSVPTITTTTASAAASVSAKATTYRRSIRRRSGRVFCRSGLTHTNRPPTNPGHFSHCAGVT